MTTPTGEMMEKNKVRWFSVVEKEPLRDGTCFLSAYKYVGGWVYTQTKFGTFHPNAKGDSCFRDVVGHKVTFTHWAFIPNSPDERRK